MARTVIPIAVWLRGGCLSPMGEDTTGSLRLLRRRPSSWARGPYHINRPRQVDQALILFGFGSPQVGQVPCAIVS